MGGVGRRGAWGLSPTRPRAPPRCRRGDQAGRASRVRRARRRRPDSRQGGIQARRPQPRRFPRALSGVTCPLRPCPASEVGNRQEGSHKSWARSPSASGRSGSAPSKAVNPSVSRIWWRSFAMWAPPSPRGVDGSARPAPTALGAVYWPCCRKKRPRCGSRRAGTAWLIRRQLVGTNHRLTSP